MVRARVTKAVNPHRRKLSLKQIAAGFGGNRRRAALKTKRRSSAKKHRHAAPKAASGNPKRRAAPAKKRRKSTAKRRNATPKVVYRTRTKVVTKRVYVKRKRKASAKRRKSSNPGHYLLTMSPVGNPTVRKKRRKTTMAKHRRKASAKSRSGKRRNPTRRSVRRRSIKRSVRRYGNPFGGEPGFMKELAGGFVAFSAAKKVPPMLGPTANSSPIMTMLTTAGIAAVTYWITKRFFPGPAAKGALLGGGLAVVNVAWNAWAPSQVSPYLGIGDFVPGSFPLPQGPVRYIAGAGVDPSMVNQAPVNTGAFGSAW